MRRKRKRKSIHRVNFQTDLDAVTVTLPVVSSHESTLEHLSLEVGGYVLVHKV